MARKFIKYNNNYIYYTLDTENKPYFFLSSIFKCIGIINENCHLAYIYAMHKFKEDRIVYCDDNYDYMCDPYGVTFLLKFYYTKNADDLLKFLENKFPLEFSKINPRELNTDFMWAAKKIGTINKILDKIREEENAK